MSLIDEIKIKSLSEAQEILKAVGSEDIFEKAHKDGDLHPNGKWVWVSSAAGGKGDWRTLNGRTHKKHQASGIVGSGTVSSSAVNSTGSGNSVGGNKSVNTTTGASSKNTSTTKKVKSDFDKTAIEQSLKKNNGKLVGVKEKDGVIAINAKFADYFDVKDFEKQNKQWRATTNTGNNYEFVLLNKKGIEHLRRKGFQNLPSSTITTEDDASSINPTFQKYFSISDSKFTDPKKMSVSKTPQGNWSLSYEGKRISTVAPLTDADKKELESAGVTFDDTFKPKQKVKTNSETYSHDINGVSVNVSKNKDGSYTLEANGKKVKSDDPSFFKDKLTPRVKKALAKELGIDVKNPKQFDVKQIGDFISSIKTTHGDVSFIPKNGAIYLGKRRDYIGDCDEEEKTIELRQNALSNVKRDREAIKEIASALKEKFGFVSKTIYEDNPRHGLKKAYMKIVLKPSESKKSGVKVDIDTTSKKTSSTNSLKSPSKVFKKIPAKNSDELYKKTLSYRGGRISAKTNNGLIEGTIQNSTKKDDRVVLTIKKDDGSLTKISTSIRGTSKYQAPQPDASKIKEIKDGKKEVKISSATGKTDWSTVNYLINSGMEIQYRHGLSFRTGSNSSKKISAEEALEKINKNTTFDASVEGGILYINTYSGFDMD